MDDLSAINKVVEERLASYHYAQALASAKRRGVHATWALQDRPTTLLFQWTETPPADQHSAIGYLDPINSPMPYMVFKF